MRVVWELDNWKKNEEAKFKIEMKQREIDYMNKIAEKWNKQECEREKTLKVHETNFESIETKIRSKVIELQKRENKISLFESEMQTKLVAVANEIFAKNKEIDKLKSDHEMEVQKLTKANKDLERKVKRLEEQIEHLNNSAKSLKEELETHPVNQLRTELEEKESEKNKLLKDIETYVKLKEEYEKYTTQLHNENNMLKKDNENIKNQAKRDLDNEMKLLKLKVYEMGINDKGNNLSDIKKEFIALKDQRLPDNNNQRSSTPANDRQQIISNSEISKLMQEREFLINLGLDENDPLVKDVKLNLSRYDLNNI